MKPRTDTLAAWCRHGLSREGKFSANGEEFSTECFFCSNSTSFYLNPVKNVYKCHSCDRGGNFFNFLKEVHEINKTLIKDYHYVALAEDRKLPIDALRILDPGFSVNGTYTFPVYDTEGKLVGLDSYKTGRQPDGSSNKVYHSSHPAKISLYNAQKLKDHLNGPIYICEGMWDGLALEWLLRETGKEGLVIAVPGCNTNIGPWEAFFYDKDVIVCYDNDRPGQMGEFKVYQTLSDKARTIAYLHWPKGKAVGYDVRDHVVKWALRKNDPNKALKIMDGWLWDIPRELRKENKTVINGEISNEKRAEKLEPISWEKLMEAYHQLLYMPDTTPMKVLLGTIMANRYRAEMVWMFLVAPPSSGKSELIMSLSKCEAEIENITTVTEKTFVSGFIGPGGADVSLFNKLKNRMMAVKDFTPLLQSHPDKQAAVFSILRDAYDGSVDAMYGHGTHRRYKGLHFGIIGGVTAVVETFGKMQQALGERFLRYYLPISEKDAAKIHEKSTENMTHDKKIREDLQYAVLRFLGTDKQVIFPERPAKIMYQIDKIAKFTVTMRAVVPKDFKERLLYTPPEERTTRVFKQMSNLAMGIARLEKKTVIGLDELKILKEVALSTCPDISKIIVRALYYSKLPMSIYDLEESTGFPIFTIKYYIEDLRILKLVGKIVAGTKVYYTISDKLKKIIEEAEIYEEPKKKRFFIG